MIASLLVPLREAIEDALIVAVACGVIALVALRRSRRGVDGPDEIQVEGAAA